MVFWKARGGNLPKIRESMVLNAAERSITDQELITVFSKVEAISHLGKIIFSDALGIKP